MRQWFANRPEWPMVLAAMIGIVLWTLAMMGGMVFLADEQPVEVQRLHTR